VRTWRRYRALPLNEWGADQVAPPFMASMPFAIVDPSLTAVGEHTVEIIASLPGYSADDIPLLLACGAIRLS
jgi:hypothetical protein